MPRGRHTHLTVSLTPQERRTLEAWQRAQTVPVGRARRGRILLLVADGGRIGDIARLVGISRRFVYKWVARFQAYGLAGLVDLPRPAPAHRRRAAREEEAGEDEHA
jgi:helix-turn-helix protein